MKSISFCLACVGLSLLTACQSTDTPPTTKNMEVNQQTQYLVEVKASLDKLKKDIDQGKADQLAYFAPNTFKEAVIEFNNATEEYSDIGRNGVSSLNIFKSEAEQYQEAEEEIMTFIALSNQKLQFAYSIRKTAETTLAETFTQQALLKNIGTPQVYANAYKRITARIHVLVKNIDNGEVTKAQEKQPALLIDMRALELNTVRKNALSQLDNDIALIKKKNLATSVPISFQQLLTARSNADAVITANPRATTEIKTAVKLAKFELAHLHHMAEEVDALKKTNEKSFEQYLLAKEALLHTISESLESDDVRDLALAEQVKSIALKAKTTKEKLSTAAATVMALESNNTQSTAATQNLKTKFEEQLVNLTDKYDTLVLENTELNKTIQSKNIEIIRLEAYKEAVIQVEGKHAAEKALALKAQAKKEAEQKALALAEKTKREAKERALALEEKVQKEAAALEEKMQAEAAEKQSSLQASTQEVAEVDKVIVETEVAEPVIVEAKIVETKVVEAVNSQ